jgi:YVTN family beta-propeller protein
MKYLAILLAAQVGAAAVPNYKLVDTIAIGGEARWDYVFVDSAAHRLYVAHGNQVEVVDTRTDKQVGSITGLNGAHGVATVPSLGLGYATSGGDDAVLVFDLATLKQTASIKVGKKPDAIVYDAPADRVLAFNGHSNSVSIIDPKRNTVQGTVTLAGNPEFGVVGDDGMAYVNIESGAELDVLDVRAAKVARTISLKPCEEPTGLALDDQKHLYSVCRNKLMAITDLASGKVAMLANGSGPDGAAWLDGYAFSANGGDGKLAVVGQVDGKFEQLAAITTAYGARTVAADPATHRLYLPTADFKQAEGTGKRQGQPGTFRVLVFEKQ